MLVMDNKLKYGISRRLAANILVSDTLTLKYGKEWDPEQKAKELEKQKKQEKNGVNV